LIDWNPLISIGQYGALEQTESWICDVPVLYSVYGTVTVARMKQKGFNEGTVPGFRAAEFADGIVRSGSRF
jgi:hypothetical protein